MSKKKYAFISTIGDQEPKIGTGYPPPLDGPCSNRVKIALGNAVGLSQFGVNLLTLSPGDWSAQRHWHENEDEFIHVLQGEVTLITDEGETVLREGAIAGFPAGQQNGHHLVNKSREVAIVLEVGTRAEKETASYPDIDLQAEGENGKYRFFHKNGEPYA